MSLSESLELDALQRAAVRLGEIPVNVDALLDDCCDGLGCVGATLVAGKGLDAVQLASHGSAEGTPVMHIVPTSVWTVLYLYGDPPAEAAVGPWLGILAGAVARRIQGAGDARERLFFAGTLMRMMAHDLRNLLGVFDQNLIFVKQELEELKIPSDATAFEDIGQVREASGQVLGYVQRVHELAHILQGPWTAGASAERFEHGLQGMEGALEGGLNVRVRLAPDLHDMRVDESRIELIATELIQNARNAGARKMTIDVANTLAGDALIDEWVQSLPAGPYVFWSTEDAGEGMDVFVLARCGEPLFSHPPRSERAGLGFSLMQAVLGAVGGQMAITSTRGEGTRVVLAIPAAHHPAPGSSGNVTVLVPEAVRMKVAVRLADSTFDAWVRKTLVANQFVVVEAISDAAVLVADREGAEQFHGPPTSLLYVGKGWPAGMSRPDAVMAPHPDRDGFIRRLSMAVARRARKA
jgi:signal transduction histidine kinase